jgi:uncharacterized protein (DUF2132 family)
VNALAVRPPDLARRVSTITPENVSTKALLFRGSLLSSMHPNDPLHGLTLEKILAHLVEGYGWEELGRRSGIRCFTADPSLKSCLNFLRKTPWARKKVEAMYLGAIQEPPHGA